MPRLTCMTVALAVLLVLSSSIVYTYFIKPQPYSSLLAAIKARHFPLFSSHLSAALSSLPTYSPVDVVHFGDGRTLAHAIAMHGTEAMLSHIHSLHFSLDSASPSDLRTPLHVAALYNSPAFLRLLLRLTGDTAEVDPVASNGFTPLLYAVLFSQHDNVRTLLEKGADPNVRAGTGLSALQMAVVYSDDAVIESLLDYGGALRAEEGYYDDVQRVRAQVAARKAREQTEATAGGRDDEEELREGEGRGVEVDGYVLTQPAGRQWRGRREEEESSDVDELEGVKDAGQRMKARHWREKRRVSAGGQPFEPLEWQQ